MESRHTENRSSPRHTHLAGNLRSSRAEGWSYWNRCGRQRDKSSWAASDYKSWTAQISAEPPDVLLFHWMITHFLWFLEVFNKENRNVRTAAKKTPLIKDLIMMSDYTHNKRQSKRVNSTRAGAAPEQERSIKFHSRDSFAISDQSCASCSDNCLFLDPTFSQELNHLTTSCLSD